MSMKRKVKVLLTCIGHQPKELFLRKIKESKKYNYQIIGTDINKNTKNLLLEFCRCGHNFIASDMYKVVSHM